MTALDSAEITRLQANPKTARALWPFRRPAGFAVSSEESRLLTWLR